MNETITLNKGVLIWIAAAVAVIVGVSIAAMMLKKNQDVYIRSDPNTGAPIVHPAGAAPGWELMPRYSTAPANTTTGPIKHFVPLPGSPRGMELMPAAPPQGGGTLAK